MTSKSGLVVTAHPGDFVWRAGGAIALHASKGYRIKIVCLSYGERGESQFAWKKAGVRLEDVVLVTKTGCKILSRFPKQLEI